MSKPQPVQQESTGKLRQFRGTPGKVITYFIAAFMFYELLYIGGALQFSGIFIFGETHRAVTLGLALCLTFLFVPARRKDRDRLPWYDILFILLILVTFIYLATQYKRILVHEPSANLLQQAFGLITLVLILEGLRRSIGWILTVLGIVFAIYPAISSYMPGLFHGPGYSFQRMMEVYYLYPEGIYGSFAHIFATILIAFLLFGSFLRVSGAGEFFINISLALLGHVRGGPAKVAVLSSGFFGMINGGTMANVASTGAITIPLMKRTGYKPHFAAAVEAVASTGGCLAPPVMGVAAFIMMDFLGVSYLTIMIVAILPAFLFFLALFLMVDFEAGKTGLRGLPRTEMPSLKKTLRDGWIHLIPIAALMFFILVPRYSAETSAVYTIVVVVLVSYLKKEKRMGPAKVRDALVGAMQGIPQIAGAIAIAGILSAVMVMTGVGITLSAGIVDVAGGNFFIHLVLVAMVSIILGMGLPSSATYIITALVMAPSLMRVGVEPIYAHFFVYYFGMTGHITPPVCLTTYVAATIAESSFMRTGFTASRLGIVGYLVPFMFIYSPALLLRGTPGEIVTALVTSLIAVVFLATAIEGYVTRATGWIGRICLLAGAVLMIVPGLQTGLIGLALGGPFLLWQLRELMVRIVMRRGGR